jgi:hypothetical protein
MGERESKLMGSNDVQQGLRDVGAEVALGRPSLFVGRAGDGYALVAGTPAAGATQVGHGHMVIVGLQEVGLRALRARIDSLLGEHDEPTLPEGLIVQ